MPKMPGIPHLILAQALLFAPVSEISGDTPPAGSEPGPVSSREPRILKLARVKYPSAASRAGLGGVVRLKVTVDDKGKVSDIQEDGHCLKTR